MRNILVCVKYCLDSSLPLQILEDEYRVVQKNMPSPIFVINPPDLCALEEAMRIKTLLNANVVAVSLGSNYVIPALKYCLGRGVDRAIHLSLDEESHPLDPCNSAGYLADIIKVFAPLLVLCGNKSIDDGSGLVGPFLAEYLDLPQITDATQLSIDENDNLIAHRRLERGGRQVVTSKLPVLITVSGFINHPRYVSVFKQHHIQESMIERIEIKSTRETTCQIINMGQPKPRPRKMNTPGQTLNAVERLKFMMTGGLTKKESNIFEGTADEAAQKLFDYFKKNGIL